MGEQQKRVIGFELKAINNLIRRNMCALLDVDASSALQGPLIGFIRRQSAGQDVFQKDIEKEFHVRRSTASVMLQNLEQKGMITRVPVEYDARMKKIQLTPKAEQFDDIVRGKIDAFHEKLESGLTAEEKEAFFRILDKIRCNLEDGDTDRQDRNQK